jgi:hypothetical protein
MGTGLFNTASLFLLMPRQDLCTARAQATKKQLLSIIHLQKQKLLQISLSSHSLEIRMGRFGLVLSNKFSRFCHRGCTNFGHHVAEIFCAQWTQEIPDPNALKRGHEGHVSCPSIGCIFPYVCGLLVAPAQIFACSLQNTEIYMGSVCVDRSAM